MKPGGALDRGRAHRTLVLRCQPRFLDYADQFCEVVAVISCAAHEVVGASDECALFCVGGANEERRRSAEFRPREEQAKGCSRRPLRPVVPLAGRDYPGVARSGAGTSAAPAITRPNASRRPMIPTAPRADRLAEDKDPAQDRGEVGGHRGDRDHLDRKADLQAARGRVEGNHERDQRGQRPWAEQAEHRPVDAARAGACSVVRSASRPGSMQQCRSPFGDLSPRNERARLRRPRPRRRRHDRSFVPSSHVVTDDGGCCVRRGSRRHVPAVRAFEEGSCSPVDARATGRRLLGCDWELWVPL